MTFGAAWTFKTELPPTRELNFHKIAEFRKVRKSSKKWSEKRLPERDKNRLCDPICLRVGGLAAPAGTNTCPCGSTMQKTSKAGPPDTKKLIHDTEKQRKTCLESAQKRPSAEKKRASCVRGSKTQGNVMDERRAPPKTGDGPQKKHERRNERHPTRMMQKNTASFPKTKKMVQDTKQKHRKACPGLVQIELSPEQGRQFGQNHTD